MGSEQSKQTMANSQKTINNQTLNLIQLNYSGILLSPFQFYSQQYAPLQEFISKSFKKCIEQQFKGQFDQKSFQWQLGHIDIKLQKERYSPLYNEFAGVTLTTGKLMSRKQFQNVWDFKMQKLKKQVQDFKITQKQLKNAKIFDFLCYKALVMYTYKVENIQNIQVFDPIQYTNVMKMFFSKSYVNQYVKIQKFLKGIKQLNFDVLFLQQTTPRLLEQLNENPQYKVYESKTQKKESIVLLRKNKFKKFHDVQGFINSQNPQVKELLTWNSDMAISVVDNYIFISGHLSSKPQKNSGQVLHMNKCIKKLSDMYPQTIIVIGCDVNTHYHQAPIPFHIYPISKMEYTNVKKRTFMQAQYKKADKLIESCVDFLISNRELNNTYICDLTGKPKNRMNVTYIPKEDHPFDHFLVCGSLGQPKKNLINVSQKSITCQF